MSYYKDIEEIANKNNGIVTSRMVKEESIPSIYLTRMVKQGKLKKVDRGVYFSSNATYDEYYLFYLKNKKSVYSFSSALFLHELTDRIPYQLEITVPNNYNSSHIKKDVIIHKVLKKYYSIGSITKETMFGNKVACYDMERTICDLVRFRDKVDVEIFRKALQLYKNHENRDFHKLRQYAISFNISKQINELLDVIWLNKNELTSVIHKISSERNVPFSIVLQLYFFESFLDRIAQSQYNDKFVLKGGFLLSSLLGIHQRSTLDMDFNLQDILFTSENIQKVLIESINRNY